MMELVKQDQYAPFSTEDEIVAIWAGSNGKMDDVPVADIRRFEREMLDTLHREHKSLLTSIVEGGKMSDDTIQSLSDAVDSFKKQFETSDGKLLGEG